MNYPRGLPASDTFISNDVYSIYGIVRGECICELKGISYSLSRRQAPVYTLGVENPRSMRDRRGIGGSMIFTANEYRGLFLNSIIDEDGNIPAESQVDQLPAFDVVVQARAPRDLDEAREWTRLFFRGVEILNQGDGTEVPHLPEPGVLVPPSEKQVTYIADSIDYGLLRNIDSNINQDDNTNMGVINFEL